MGMVDGQDQFCGAWASQKWLGAWAGGQELEKWDGGRQAVFVWALESLVEHLEGDRCSAVVTFYQTFFLKFVWTSG